MTLIECFDRKDLENLAGTLYLHPDKVILVGDEEKMSRAYDNLKAVIFQRSMKTRVELCDIAGMKISQIADELESLVRKNGDCVIDLTGGEEPVILAVGAVLERMGEHGPKVQKFDLNKDLAIDCDGDGKIVPCQPVKLTVREIVALHGGIVHPLAQMPEDASLQQVNQLWKYMGNKPTLWNKMLTILAQVEKRSEEKEMIEVSRHKLRSEIKDFAAKQEAFEELLFQFEKRGIITNRSNSEVYRYSYNSECYRYCTRKAGNLLELKVLLEAKNLYIDGQPFFDDCAMGVGIDWDGIVHGREEPVADTHNEMDVILTRGMKTLFISCKNGDVEDEMYKLHTVAERFGGPAVRKVLVATNLTFDSPASKRSFDQRAWDMDIRLATHVGSYNAEKWKELFVSLMK